MDWYYANGGQRIGPVSEATFSQKVQGGEIRHDTLVWREGMAEWQPYSTVPAPEPAAAPVAAPQEAVNTQTCAECGKPFATSQMIQYDDAWICAGCKPVFVQKVQEGVAETTPMVYGGFWIRFAAKFIDGILLAVVNMVFAMVYTELFGQVTGAIVNMFSSIILQATYATILVGRYGATLGKMACGLKVVMYDGSPVSYGRACGRHFAEWLSSMTLMIGYLMAAFDDQKRTLHDRICATRVVKR